MDNSTKEFCTEDMKTVFTVIDNTNYKLKKGNKNYVYTFSNGLISALCIK